MQRVEADIAISISDLKKNLSNVIRETRDEAVAILNHNKVASYLLPAKLYEDLMDRLEDLELAEIIKSRADETPIKVDLNEL